ncbi:MAG: PP2C family protein-serine/threonine phosphatase [Alphaproteobacteria bacterium]
MTSSEQSVGDRPARPSTAFHFRSSGLTHTGLVRKHNEDAFLDSGSIGLWAVADGMGGHESGDYASQLIVDTLAATKPPESASALLHDVKHRLDQVHLALQSVAASRGEGSVIASTVVVLMAHGGHYACVWAGDSRAYRCRGSVLQQLTKDHSYVQSLVDQGVLQPERAATHPYANVVTRAVGTDQGLDLELITGELAPHDRFLLCSDGLNRQVGDPEIATVLASAGCDQAATTLVDLALQSGARDNVTALVIDVQPATVMIDAEPV